MSDLVVDPQTAPNPATTNWVPVGPAVVTNDTAPVGATIAFSGTTIPGGYVLADGARYPQAQYPQAYIFAGQEVAAGNPLWTQRTSDTTFTVPDLRDRFLFNASAAIPFGQAGGEKTHQLTVTEMPSHIHNRGDIYTAAPPNNPGAHLASGDGGVFYSDGGNGFTADSHGTGLAGGDTSHNTMPPYVAIAQIVKLQPAPSAYPASVVNGQFVKGVGGAAAWSPITPADVANIPYGTSLPASPYDGQEAILVDSATNPTYQWRFRYNAGSSSAYKWEFVGGAPVILNYDQAGALMNNPAFTTDGTYYWWKTATPGDPAAPGSIYPVPRSGDYRVLCKQQINNNGGVAATAYLVAAYFPTATTISQSITMQSWVGVSPLWNNQNVTASILRGISSGGYVGMAWNADNGNNFAIRSVYVEIVPVRVS